ncbi:peptidase U32 family protein [Candidatus Omnitrophota bacterium]
MKIKSPLTNKEEVKPLCEAGADELFCGIEPYNWRRRYKDFCTTQRSTFANFKKLSDLARAIRIAHQYKTKVHVAMNAFFYLEEQYKMARRIVKDILGIGADGIIFADPGVLSLMDRDLLKDKDVIAGCDTVIFNHQAAKFYKRFGITRIVLPRSMTVKEMEQVIRNDGDLEYEVFIIHDLCFFEDGLCAYCKEQTGGTRKQGRARGKVYFFAASRLPLRGHGGGCGTPVKRQRIYFRKNRKISFPRPVTFRLGKNIDGCGACAIYDLKRIGVTSLKVLDRNLSTPGKIKATNFINSSLGLLNGSFIPKIEYRNKCKSLFKKTFKTRCDIRDCYYPLNSSDL